MVRQVSEIVQCACFAVTTMHMRPCSHVISPSRVLSIYSCSEQVASHCCCHVCVGYCDIIPMGPYLLSVVVVVVVLVVVVVVGGGVVVLVVGGVVVLVVVLVVAMHLRF